MAPNKSMWDGIGHLGRDAELKETKAGNLVEFSLAVTNKRAQSTAWFRCSWFGKQAEAVLPYLQKGKAVNVYGELVPREYKAKNDELRTSLDVRVSSVTLLGDGGAKAEPAKASAADDSESDLPF